MSSPDSENVLSEALRAQAGGGAAPGAPEAPAPPPPAPAPAQRRQLPVLGVLVFALLLGLVAGAVVALFTVLPLPVL